jgi:GT2 family glycosyltransferase
VIVNYRTADLTEACLRALARDLCEEIGLFVTIVDNASGDGSAERLEALVRRESWQTWVQVLASMHNGGFAAGNNVVIRKVLAADDPPAYVLLLNPDTEPRVGAISALVDFMEAHPEAGLAGSRLEDPDGTPQRSAFRFHSILGELENAVRLGILTRLLSRWVVAPPVVGHAFQCDWVSGASVIFRQAVLRAIGTMDEEYFLYFEETDYCLAARRAGWRCYYVPESRVMHLVAASTGVSSRPCSPRRPAYWFESRRRYFRKNHGKLYALACDVVWIAGFASWRLRRILQRKPDTDPDHLLKDFIRHSALIKWT